ncbi:cytochrome p450 [Lichtheimia corymbifera JMRC:FSU:9682]|uniref:Cytochrome p450 n=1 Tax=Lichtheimia corymbifera JMRC:FSU:9682 TaxID=1263082 RepID=A0A068RV60_9FUNG|nr:cytochrome p450 [Lichtheimia corymbifera JMRC:FSU:9682]
MDLRLTTMADPLRAWVLKKKSTLGPIARAVAVLWIISRLQGYLTASKSRSSKLPSPRFALPYFGHLFNLGPNTIETFCQWHKRYGPIILIQMGVKQMVSISDPFIAQEVLGTNGSLAANRPYNKYMTKLFGKNERGIVFAETKSKSWRKARGIATTILGPNNVNKKLPEMGNETEELVNALATGNNIDPSEHILRLSLNYMLLNCFGIRAASTDDPIFKKCIYLIKYTMVYTGLKYMISEYLPVLSFLDYLIGGEKTFAKHIETERDAWIREWMMNAHDDGKDCIATALLESVHSGDIDEATAIVTLADLLFAGTDTAAVTIGWAFGILSVKPDVQRKIQQELDHFIETHRRMPIFTDRDHFPYMIAVQKECMRFRPTTPLGVTHVASEDIVWRSKIIPKGAIIASNMIAMHMNPDVYPEPHVFRPERFLDKTETFTASAKSKIEDRDQYNFGWGRRLCPGSYLAEVHMFNAFTRVFARCTIEQRVDDEGCPVPLDLERFLPQPEVVIVTAHPSYQVRFVRRTEE